MASQDGTALGFWKRLIPIALLLALYWPGLTNWFYQDDFGWLRLRQSVHSVRDVPSALFAPKAHGNIRPLGENAYWLLLSSVFGAEALPFRVCAFLTQIASLLLLGSIVLHTSKSPVAALAAPLLWIVNCGLAPAMSWSSIYNQVLSGFFFLLAFWFLLRRMHRAHWAAFVLGLGALETNVMYPAIAAAYALLYDRSLLRKIAPMFLFSAAYMGIHFYFAGSQPGAYALHFDASIPLTFAAYWAWSLGRVPLPVILALSASIAVFVIWRIRQRDFLPLFGLAWFAITLAPYLPLRDHFSDYYLAVPAIGIAIIGSAAAIRAPRAAATVGISIYLALSLPPAWTLTRWYHDRSRAAEDLVMGVAEIRRHDPGKIILLDGIDTSLFQAVMVDVPFLALQIPYVYLAPGASAKIHEPTDLVSKFELPEGMALDAVKSGRAVVYLWEAGLLRNATTRYRKIVDKLWRAGPPRFVNLGDPVFQPYLGPGWDSAVDGYRGLKHAASLRMSGGESLTIGVFHTRDFSLRLKVNGVDALPELVGRDNELSLFRTRQAGISEWMEISFEVGEPVVFGFAEVR
jgi:hypothetical protein